MKRMFASMLIASMMVTVNPLSVVQQAAAENGSINVTSITVDDSGNVVIVFSDAAESLSVKDFTISDKNPRIVVDISGAQLASAPKNVAGIEGGAVKKVRSSQHAVSPVPVVRVVCDVNTVVDYSIDKAGRELMIITGKTTTSRETTPANEPTLNKKFSGKETESIIDNLSTQPVTLDFNEADIADVFRILSAKSGVNIIYGDDVVGELSIHLEQVPFKEAFKTILSLKSLVAQQVGENILRIITPEALATQRSKSVTFWRVYPLNYADVAEAKKQIDAIRGAEGRRGIIEVDQRTNSLVIADSPDGLDDIARLIKEIDKKPQQVLIESRFVEVALDSSLNLGIDWGYYDYNENDTGDKATQIGEFVDDETGRYPPSVKTGVNAMIPDQIGSFEFGFLKRDALGNIKQAFLARLAALASEGKAKFLSNPRITTLNNQEASIWVGTQLPIRTLSISDSGSETYTTTYKQVGIELKVTPTINVDDRITLKIRPEVNLPDTTNISSTGDIPINTRYAETTVLIRDDETLVIGGFIEENKTEGVDKVPLLGDIPILGQFFRSNTNTKSRRELLVFITPKILKD